MEYGIVLPHNEIGTDPGAIKAFAQGAEALAARDREVDGVAERCELQLGLAGLISSKISSVPEYFILNR